VSVSLRRKRLEHGGWSDGQMAQANPDRRKNGIADSRRDHRCARLAEADGSLDALDELNGATPRSGDALSSAFATIC
jgi:hypothetical protein